MRTFVAAAICSIVIASSASAHHPTAGLWVKRPEPFDWIERLEPKSYRARYNRPRYLGGKIAYTIAPSSQEAMSWHEHVHRGTYKRHEGPIYKQYFYPKPWEVLNVRPRPDFSSSEMPQPPAVDPPSVIVDPLTDLPESAYSTERVRAASRPQNKSPRSPGISF